MNLLVGTVSGTVLIDGPMTCTWTFQWETEYSSSPALDRVYITPTGQCGTAETLQYNSPALDHTITRLANGHFQHTMVAHERPCIINCNYSYYCESANNLVVSNHQANPKTFKTKFCAQ